MTKPECEQTQTANPSSATPNTGDTLTALPRATEATLTHAPGGDSASVDRADWQIGAVVDGKYEVQAVLGHGGMGIVYKVHHREWDVDMAVKMPLASLVADEASKARFIREAQTWVELGLHPNIVQCWYVREIDGVLRLFVDFIPGGSLKDWIKQGKVRTGEWGKIIDLAVQACDGLGYAHERGVVHRDVKPANLLMAEDGRLCVTDFGLVKVAGVAEIEGGVTSRTTADGQHSLTITGSSLGTAEYGAPEQWGQARHVDGRADVYALGIVLFELSVGRRPFDDGSHSEPAHVLIGRHLSTPAPNARELNPEVPEALATVVAKCLAKKPDNRPASMTALRAELAQAYAQIMGQAYPRQAPQPSELRADALNNRGVSLWDIGEKEAAFAAWREAQGLQPGQPECVLNEALALYSAGKISDQDLGKRLAGASTISSPKIRLYLGLVLLQSGYPQDAESALRGALEHPDVMRLSHAWRALGDVNMRKGDFVQAKQAYQKGLDCSPNDLVTLERHQRAARWLDWYSPRFGASAARLFARLGIGGMTPAKAAQAAVPDDSVPEDAVVVPCHPQLEGVRARGFAFCGTSNTNPIDPTRSSGTPLEAAAVTADGKNIVCSSSGVVFYFEPKGWQITKLGDHGKQVAELAITPDRRYVIAQSIGLPLKIWDRRTGTSRITATNQISCRLVPCPDSKRLVVGDGSVAQISVIDLESGNSVLTIKSNPGGNGAVAITPDGRFGVSAASDAPALCVWNLDTGEESFRLEGLDEPAYALEVLPGGKLVAALGKQGSLRVWELASRRRITDVKAGLQETSHPCSPRCLTDDML